MECCEVERLLDACLDRELPTRDADELQSHVAACAACRRRIGPMMELLTSPKDVEVPSGLRERVMAAVAESDLGVLKLSQEAGQRQKWASRLRWVRWSGAVAASIAFVAAGWMGAGWLGRQSHPGTRVPNPPAPQTTVVLSPWMLSGLAQAMTTYGPVNPVAFVAQATVSEMLATPSFEDVPVIPAHRHSATRRAPSSDTGSSTPEIPVLPPILRL